MNTLGGRIKYHRNKKELTQKEFAAILKVPRDTLANWEVDRATPSVDMLAKIADYFEVTTDYLLGRPQPETIAAHRTDDPMDELPPEARRSVEEFMDYIHKKYGKKN